MDIYSEKGTKVVYMGCSDEQLKWGGSDDPRQILIPGAVYAVDYIWYNIVVLEEYPDKIFNTVFFD